jgi:hypothetical protein
MGKRADFWPINGQNRGSMFTDSLTVVFFMLFIPCLLQDFFEKLSYPKGVGGVGVGRKTGNREQGIGNKNGA